MTMTLDPILSEVRQIREQYAEQFHGDARAMMEDLRRRHAESKHQSANRDPKPAVGHSRYQSTADNNAMNAEPPITPLGDG
jgi:hypothetical protein